MPRNEFGFHTASPKKKRPAVPRPRKISKRDLIRKAWRSAGALEYLPKVRKTPTDLERILEAAHVTERIAKNLTFKEQQQLEADLSAIGIMAGRTSGSLPERLVAKWLLDKGVEYAGMGYEADITRGFSFQVPLVGGRSDFGSVVDIFLSGRVAGNKQGTALRVQGTYFHNTAEAIGHDEAQRMKLVAAGFEVADVWDTEILNPGSLDSRMKSLVTV